MSKNLLIVVLLMFVLFTSGCVREDRTSIKAVTSELKIESSSDQVENFLSKNKKYRTILENENDPCFNITPDFISNNSDYSIFKYTISTASFLLFDDEVYPLGLFGGLTSMALGDLDKDNHYELFFTFGWGSGEYRSQIGYFNPATKEVTVFEYNYFNHDLILTTNKAKTSLSVNEATTERDSQVDFIVKSNFNKLVANIVSEKGNIKLDVVDNELP